MSHPETYYEAKAAFLAAAEDAGEYLRPNAVEALLESLGWTAPGPARDAGKLVKVFHVEDLLYVLPSSFREEHPFTKSASCYSGVMVGASKTDVADRSLPKFVRSGRARLIGVVAPTDLRYPLAVAYPHKIVVQLESFGTPYGERHMVPLSSLRLDPQLDPKC